MRDVAFLAQFRTIERAYHRFYLYTSGRLWTLSVGKAVGDELRKTCFASSPGKPMLVGDFGADVRYAFRYIFGAAKEARNIQKYLSGEL